jgi:DNA-binding transcriptional ArsR family regulator
MRFDMTKKMISALKEVVGETVELDEKRGRIKSALMNNNRLVIFKFLCMVPGCSANGISEHLGLSLSTVKWHLEILKMEKYAAEVSVGNRIAYFPNGIADQRYMEVLSILNEELPMMTFWTLLKNQGLTQKGLLDYLDVKVQPLRLAIKKLVNLNLILSVIDGRFRRYYPTDEIYVLANRNRRRMRQFKINLLKKLEDELLNPKIHISKSGDRIIEITVDSRKDQIYIPSDLSTSILSYRAEKLEGGSNLEAVTLNEEEKD